MLTRIWIWWLPHTGRLSINLRVNQSNCRLQNCKVLNREDNPFKWTNKRNADCRVFIGKTAHEYSRVHFQKVQKKHQHMEQCLYDPNDCYISWQFPSISIQNSYISKYHFDTSQSGNRYTSSTNGLIVYVVKKPVSVEDWCVLYWCEKAR